MSKRDDHKNPDLYKDAPGDKAARKKGTKPSPYTLRFKQMYGEDAVARAKARIDREKKSDAARHDNMMDRARLQKVGHKPGTTPQQWGMARVNSFITGGRTRVKGDPDLWAKQKGKIRK